MKNKIIKFVINGILISLLNLFILNSLYYIGFLYLISIIISCIITIIINYFISSKYIFIGGINKKSFLNYILSNFMGFIIFSIISMFLYKIGISIYIGQIIAIGCSALVNFLYNNFVTFKKNF